MIVFLSSSEIRGVGGGETPSAIAPLSALHLPAPEKKFLMSPHNLLETPFDQYFQTQANLWHFWSLLRGIYHLENPTPQPGLASRT